MVKKQMTEKIAMIFEMHDGLHNNIGGKAWATARSYTFWHVIEAGVDLNSPVYVTLQTLRLGKTILHPNHPNVVSAG